MKPFLLIFAVLFSPCALAASAHFTTVFFDDEGIVYVGVKQGEAPGNAEIISFPFDSGVRTNIPLPAEILHRDVIGLIPAKDKLFVLTNGNGEPGEGPMLHVYDRARNKWNLVGKVVCPTFTKVTLQASQMIFSCEVGKSRKGKTKVQRRAIPLRRERIYRSGVWRFPEFMLRYKSKVVLLMGEAPVWDKLKLRAENGSERTISAEDLLKLPLPGAEAKLPLPKNGTSLATSTSTAIQTQ